MKKIKWFIFLGINEMIDLDSKLGIFMSLYLIMISFKMFITIKNKDE